MDRNIVQSAAVGQWERIFSLLAPQLREAMQYAGTHRPHVDCPIPGHCCAGHGRKKFRLNRDWRENGSGICTCGSWANGFSLLCAINGWKYGETIDRVGEALGLAQDKGITVLGMDRSQARQAEGKVLFAGFTFNGRYRVYTIRLRQKDGTVVLFSGAQLERAAHAAGIDRGDNASISLCGVQSCLGARGKFLRKSFAAVKLPSDEEAAKKLAEDARLTELARERSSALWNSACSLESDTPQAASVRKYLAARGVGALPACCTQDIRAVQGLRYRNEIGAVSSWNGMVAAVRDLQGRIVSVHRTYLGDGAKADVDRPKMLMPVGPNDTVAGCSIHLGEPERGVLCVAEGIETAASVVIGTGYPCWSCVSASGMKAVELPAQARLVLIFEDKDASGTGQAAAEALRSRLASEGRIAVVLAIGDSLPEGCHGLDWNDMLRKGRPFPVNRPV